MSFLIVSKSSLWIMNLSITKTRLFGEFHHRILGVSDGNRTRVAAAKPT